MQLNSATPHKKSNYHIAKEYQNIFGKILFCKRMALEELEWILHLGIHPKEDRPKIEKEIKSVKMSIKAIKNKIDIMAKHPEVPMHTDRDKAMKELAALEKIYMSLEELYEEDEDQKTLAQSDVEAYINGTA